MSELRYLFSRVRAILQFCNALVRLSLSELLEDAHPNVDECVTLVAPQERPVEAVKRAQLVENILVGDDLVRIAHQFFSFFRRLALVVALHEVSGDSKMRLIRLRHLRDNFREYVPQAETHEVNSAHLPKTLFQASSLKRVHQLSLYFRKCVAGERLQSRVRHVHVIHEHETALLLHSAVLNLYQIPYESKIKLAALVSVDQNKDTGVSVVSGQSVVPLYQLGILQVFPVYARKDIELFWRVPVLQLFVCLHHILIEFVTGQRLPESQQQTGQ